MARGKRGSGRRKQSRGGRAETRLSRTRHDDVYEAESDGSDAEAGAGGAEKFIDEEIDEDGAFNSEDEEMYGDFFSKAEASTSRGGGGSSPGGFFDESGGSGSEDDAESDAGDGGEVFSIMDAISQHTADDEHASQRARKPTGRVRAAQKRRLQSDASAGGPDTAEWSDDDDDDADADDALENVVGTVHDLQERSQAKRKRRLAVKEDTEFAEEGQFNAAPNQHVELSDLLDVEVAGIGDAKRRAERIAKKRTASAPLSDPQRERIQREAAYEFASKDVTKWQPTVKRNREADTLVFKGLQTRYQPSSAALAHHFKPSTDLESEVAGILSATGATVKQVREFEELEMNKLDPEAVRKRRDELARMRSLMFSIEQKARRQKKIKSRKYHKILKRQRDRRAEKDGGGSGSEGGSDAEGAEDVAEQRERERAMERMTLRHKAKKQRRGAPLPEGSRRAVEEHLQLQDDVKDAVEGGADASDGESDSSSDGETPLLANAATEAASGEAEVPKGLLGLKFMQRAAEKRREEAARVLQDLEAAHGSDDSDAEPEAGSKGAERRTMGRATFAGAIADPQRRRKDHSDGVGDAAVHASGDAALERSVEASVRVAVGGAVTVQSGAATSEARAEPQWGEGADNATAKAPKRTTRSAAAATKRAESEKVGDDENPWLARGAPQDWSDADERSSDGDNSDSDDNAKESARENDERNDDAGDDRAAREQRALLQEAFAGDEDLVEEFEEEKRKASGEDKAEKDEGDFVPGWGSWGGKGAPTPKRKPRMQPTKKKTEAERRDALLKHVIINEKKDKKLAKYMAPQQPHGFGTREQYEAAIRHPLGKEWNPSAVHDRMNRPSVITRMGAVIQPAQPNRRVK